MKIPVFLCSLALLVACNTTTSNTTPPVSPVTTLYQGDWEWAVVNVNNENDYVTGMASFSREEINTQADSSQRGKKVALGLYTIDGIDQGPVGALAMGALETPLDAVLLNGNLDPVVVGVDADGAMSVQEGKKVFVGPGVFINQSTGEQLDVVLAFVQVSTKPTHVFQKLFQWPERGQVTTALNTSYAVQGWNDGGVFDVLKRKQTQKQPDGQLLRGFVENLR